MTITINDISAGINVLLGVVVFGLELRAARACDVNRWVYVVKAMAGAALALSFLLAIIDSASGGGGLVPPAIGRPAVTLALGALAVGAIMQRHKRGNCD